MTPTHSLPQLRSEIHLANELDELNTLREWLAEIALQASFSEKTTYRLNLVLEEAITNIISYAFPDQGPHQIHVHLAKDQGTIQVDLLDDGAPFNPVEACPPPAPGELENAPIGGLGIYFIMQFTDDRRYQRVDGKNHFTLIFHDQHQE